MIGIVGGVGPMAGLDLFKKITEETPADKDQEHASVLLFSEPSKIADRTEFLIGLEKTNPGYALAEIIFNLEQAGATTVGIPCNTAHAPEIFDVTQAILKKKNSKILLLHMIKEVIKHIQRHFPNKIIGILSTTGTQKAGIYRNSFGAANIAIVEPTDHWQNRIHQTVYHSDYGIKARPSKISEKAISELDAAIGHLREKGAEVIILGCTELPLAIPQENHQGLPLIDPNRILAKALLESYKKNRTSLKSRAKSREL